MVNQWMDSPAQKINLLHPELASNQNWQLESMGNIFTAVVLITHRVYPARICCRHLSRVNDANNRWIESALINT